MSSVKISELNELFTITSDDFIPIVDSGSGTTYRVTFNTLNDWMAVYGSSSFAVSASHAVMADTASRAITSSYSFYAVSASRAQTASYYDVSGLVPNNAVSAAYAATASSLQGFGDSWEKNLEVKQTLSVSGSGWIAMPRKLSIISESILQNSVFFNQKYLDPWTLSNDWARIYYMEDNLDAGRLVFELGDNLVYHDPGDNFLLLPTSSYYNMNSLSLTYPGFLWQTWDSFFTKDTGSLMFLRADGRLFLRAATARSFTASVDGVGFLGTSSWAMGVVGGPGAAIEAPVGAIMDYAGTGAPSDPNWALCDGSELSQAGYPALYALLGTTWGTASPGNFKLPDLRKRMTIGAGTNGNYSGSVGNTGGSENLNNHYHLIGQAPFGIFPGGYTVEDFLYMVWIEDQVVNLDRDFPTQTSTLLGNTHTWFSLNGKEGSIIQPNGTYPRDGFGNTSGFIVGSSFPFVVGNGHQDVNPPYAVVNKIIRVS